MKKWVAIGCSFALLAGLLVVMDIGPVWELAKLQLLDAEPVSVAAAVFLLWLNFAISTERYRLVLSQMKIRKPKFFSLLGITYLSLFLAHFIPVGPATDVVRMSCARFLYKWPTIRVFETVVYDRLLALLGLIITGTIALPLQISKGVDKSIWLPQAIIFVTILFSIFALSYAARFPQVRRVPFAERIVNSIAVFSVATLTLGNVIRHLLIAFAYSASYGLAIWVLARGMSLSLSVLEVLQFSSFILLAQNLPVFYAGWGIREVALLGTLGAAGMHSPAEGLAISVAIGATMFLATLPGALMWLRMPRYEENTSE